MGSSSAGDFDAYDVAFDLGGVLLPGDFGTTTTYWISMAINLDGPGDGRWEYSTAGIVGHELAFTFDSGATWVRFDGEESVYTIGGECTPLPCGEANPSNGFEDAFLSSDGTSNPLQIIASDVTVEDGEDFTLNTINANLWASTGGANVASADIVIYGDAGGIVDPSNVINSQLGVIPADQAFLGTSTGGFDVYDVEFDTGGILLPGSNWLNHYLLD